MDPWKPRAGSRRLLLLGAPLLALSAAACGSSGTSSPSLPPPPALPACSGLPTPQPSYFSSTTSAGALESLHLGTFAVNAVARFEVPQGVQSVTIIEQQANPDAAVTISLEGQTFPNTVFPHSITVGNETLFDAYTDAINPGCNTSNQCGPLTALSSYYFTEAAWTGALTIPNTAAALSSVEQSPGGVPSGIWNLTVSDYANECPGIESCSTVYAYPPSAYDITVLLKTAAAAPPSPVISSAGTIDVTFYLLTDRLEQGTAKADPTVQNMLAAYGSLLSGFGLAVGNVNFLDLSAAVKQAYNGTVDATDASPCGELAQLLKNANPGNQMNLFLVETITASGVSIGGAQTTTVGIDGTIPGPASVGGTVQSGAIVSVADLDASTGCNAASPQYDSCGYEKVAYVAAHETGHFLGLYHPTEAEGNWFDPIDGTALQCPCSSCAPQGSACQDSSGSVSNPYIMAGSDCLGTQSLACQGGDYLMFWVLSGVSAGTTSPAEGQVVRANPLVY